MAIDKWTRVLDWLWRWEGGYQNNPADNGNWTGGAKSVGELKGTKYGISAAAYPTLDILNLTKEDAATIYFRDYWHASGADAFPWPLCLLIMDTAVLHGVGTSRRWLIEVGASPWALVSKRLRVYTGSRNWKLFGAGWVNRVADLLKTMSSEE